MIKEAFERCITTEIPKPVFIKDTKKKNTKKNGAEKNNTQEKTGLLEKESIVHDNNSTATTTIAPEILDIPKPGNLCMQKSLLNVLLRAYWRPVCVAGIFKLGHDLLAFGNSLF